MKILFLIRHGKATQEIMPDEKRFLIEKGIKRTRKHAKILLEKDIIPDLIISSHAVRAKETATIIAETLDYNPKNIKIDSRIYFEPMGEIIALIQNLPNNAQTVFLVGHNNLWTYLADELSSKDIWHLRTSGMFGIHFLTNDWKQAFLANRKDCLLIN